MIADYKERGVIANVGMSEVGIAQIERARKIVPIAAVQNHYNVDDRLGRSRRYCETEAYRLVPFYPLHTTNPALGDVARAHGATEIKHCARLVAAPNDRDPAHSRHAVHRGTTQNLSALDIELTDQNSPRSPENKRPRDIARA